MGLNGITVYNERSLLVSFQGFPLPEANRQVMLLAEYCNRKCGQWLTDYIPAYDSLLLICTSAEAVWKIKETINLFFLSPTNHPQESEPEATMIPVCYDLRLGNDLEQMAGYHGLPIDSLVSLHHGLFYHTYMLGFLPGFAYMGEVDARIATPRKAAPVPTRKGAVGIAGRQTGIYPLHSPGGWNIVGYTPLKMFDVHQPSPAFLKPGARVKFVPIGFEQYCHLLNLADEGS